MKVRELMTTDMVTVSPDTPLKEAARLMAGRGISGLPVLEDERVVGILSEADFVPRTSSHGRAGLIDLPFNRETRLLAPDAVGDAMTRDVISIGPDDSHVDAARTVRRRRVKRLPVIDDGHLVGVVSRADILAVFTRPDDAIEHDIRHRIVARCPRWTPIGSM